MKQLLLLICIFFCIQLQAQTYTGTGGSILDNQQLTRTISISDLPTQINQTSFGLEQICIDITHTWVEDLSISLEAPDGTLVLLISSIGGSGDNFTGTCLRVDASSSISSQSAPFTGTFKPIYSFGIVNNNQNPNGTWKLHVADGFSGDQGTLLSWSLTFGSNPATYNGFMSSNLPIVLINTNNQPIPDEPKITAHMKVIDNGYNNTNTITDFPNGYDNKIGIERRGSTSGSFPQKSYGFETRDTTGANLNTELLGLPLENDWILYAPYNDKTCMRNILTYNLANEMQQYASRTILCELVLNGQYQGVYTLMEKIKRDANRVNIAKLQPTDISGNELTGGYIIKIDKTTGANNDGWTSSFPAETNHSIKFLYHYPKPDEITPEQKEYIQLYVDSFEQALAGPNFTNPETGYRKYILPETFIDFFILTELSKNVDGYRLSSFFHKEKDSKGGKLRMGPVWDFNLAWWNADYCDGNSYTGWQYDFASVCPNDGSQNPFWWKRFLQDPWFEEELRCRWNTLRQGTLSNTSLFGKIDSIAAYIQAAQERHFEQWDILGYYTWPNPSPIPEDYDEEISALKNWITNRAAWIDENLGGICHLSTNELALTSLEVYPNPFNKTLHVSWLSNGNSDTKIKLYDMQGKLIHQWNNPATYQGINHLELHSIGDLQNGVYWIEIQDGQATARKKILKN